MPRGYQPPKFMQFDGKGNPKQHIAHFSETHNNAETEGGYLVQQFVRSLKGNAYGWYTDLEPESINSWDQLEREFLNRFCSAHHTISMLELTSIKQWKDEPVVNYINIWRSLSLDCKDWLSKTFTIEMCVQSMHWRLHYIHQGIKSRTFEKLATRSHNIELNIANYGKMSQSPTSRRTRYKNTLRELEQKTYPFPDSDVTAMLDDLLEKKMIKLPKCKCPEKMNHVNDHRYCKYHRIVSHHVGKCFVFKELAQQGRIKLDLEDMVATHTTTTTFRSFDPVPLQVTSDHSRS
ncbi:uncharacterized protein LOC125469832 [Pyrus x bretschneideri]|uniref:uncharacterized protein LOC125469832 n=1 Tax=Pyrus x bretschneideri TaxID=225117 RepID=UPI00202EAD64|nr:uncharacterized protein LOC125469832 [Pyrus x bretschneideri]